MAGTPGSSKWDLTNWSSGSVTLFQALGIKKGTISYPPLQTQLTTPAAESAQAASTNGSASAAGSAAATGVGNITGGGNTNTPAGTSETDWIKTLLNALGAPATTANINSIASWINYETKWNDTSPDGALYTNNPLNTTEPATGATNVVGSVKKYVNAASGIAATVATIQQYPPILAALKSGKGLCGSGLSSSFAKWSNNGYTSVC